MNELNSCNSYCSQSRKPFPFIGSPAEGVNFITQILSQPIICSHDVSEMNQIYLEMNYLERKFNEIPSPNSQHVLEKIVEKIKKIMSDKKLCADDIISLYHLQNFSEKDLLAQIHFKNLLNKQIQDSEIIKSIACQLPCCHSEDQFKKDALALIGSPNEDVKSILDQKIKKFQTHQNLQKEIQNRRSQLKMSSSKYPPYFDKILRNGYIHLYDHLKGMRDLSDCTIKTFSLASHIVLETRDAIFQKVKSSIPESFKNILFILGRSESGKSTFFCTLRDDEMVLKNFCYESKSDKGDLIGHGAVSCTFLPNIEIVKNWTIVDFPGFNDSHGQLISLGMECALKALIKEYQPKVLVLESIITTDRYAKASQLGLHLKRLLKNPEDCVLGITKYSKNPYFMQIRQMEEDQKRKVVTDEETSLLKALEVLIKLNDLKGQATVHQKLDKIQEEKRQTLNQYRKTLEEQENELLKQIGLKNLIKLDALEKIDLVSLCFESFSNAKAIHPNSQMSLAAEDEYLLDSLFKTNLMEVAKSVEIRNDFNDFEESVKETSLISTLFSLSNPEIGKFLHMPEMDPLIVRKFDKTIVSDCIKNYMRNFICSLDMTSIKNKLKEVKKEAPLEKVTDFESKLKRARDYILGLLGHQCKNEMEAEETWNKIWNLNMQMMEEEKDSKIPNWIAPLMWEVLKISVKVTASGLSHGAVGIIKGGIEVIKLAEGDSQDEDRFARFLGGLFLSPMGMVAGAIVGSTIGISKGLFSVLTDWHTEYITHQENIKIQQEKATIIIEDCSNSLDKACDVLFRLKDIEKLIAKQEDLDIGFNSIPILTNSENTLYESITNRINKVRSIYGADDWDRRVSFLANKFKLKNFILESQFSWLVAYAYLLIEPNVLFQTKPTNDGISLFLRANEKGKDIEIILKTSVKPRLRGLKTLRKENRLVIRALSAAALLKANGTPSSIG